MRRKHSIHSYSGARGTAGLRILHVIPSLSPLSGGPAHAIRGMCRGLLDAGEEVTIAATTARLQNPVALNRILVENGVPTIYFPCELPPHFSLSLGLRRWLKRNIPKFDVVHVHSVFTYPSTAACRIAERSHVPYIVRPLGVLSHYSMARHQVLKQLYLTAFERHNLEHAGALHFTSPSEAKEARDLGLRAPAVVLPLGVAEPTAVTQEEIQAFRARHKLESDFCFLYLGRLDPKKGLELLFESLAAARNELPKWRLLVAGSGNASYAASLREAASRTGIAEETIFLGTVSGNEKAIVFAAADAFVLASQHENFAVAAAEAMRSGLPLIVSEHVGIAPYVSQRQAGIVCDFSVLSVAEALVKMAADPELRREMGRRGRQLACEVFDWKKIADELVQLYRDLASGNAKVAMRPDDRPGDPNAGARLRTDPGEKRD